MSRRPSAKKAAPAGTPAGGTDPRWFDRDVWTHAVNDAGYAVTCR